MPGVYHRAADSRKNFPLSFFPKGLQVVQFSSFKKLLLEAKVEITTNMPLKHMIYSQ